MNKLNNKTDILLLDISDNKIDLNNKENSDIIDKVIKLKKIILKYT